MKFYKIVNGICRDNDPKRKVFPGAYLPKGMVGAEYMAYGSNEGDVNYIPIEKTIQDYHIVENTPVFDYFILGDGYSRKKFDWIRLDMYGVFALGGGFLVSERFKETISIFNLPRHKFYPAKLMYKGEKFDYYVFQLGEETKIAFEKCAYADRNSGIVQTAAELGIHSEEDYFDKRVIFFDKGSVLDIHDFVLDRYHDYFISRELFKVVSEPLKEALEAAGLTEGWKFEDISPRTITFLNS
ncbi:hypothetical protein [Runella limosa]|uniref:hypothetical protein n=1 Tax=Runella limosa TaxID=370978 RepID=UPI00041DFC95|nr:hypothetical protein [Runella limosa]